jgi:hypothetical protein
MKEEITEAQSPWLGVIHYTLRLSNPDIGKPIKINGNKDT